LVGQVRKALRRSLSSILSGVIASPFGNGVQRTLATFQRA